MEVALIAAPGLRLASENHLLKHGVRKANLTMGFRKDPPVLVGYARVSTQDQKAGLQLDALTAAGCERVFEEKASGAQRDRPRLAAAVEYMREGDTLVVWKLDRLARSVKQLIETVDDLDGRGIGFRSLTEAIDTTCRAVAERSPNSDDQRFAGNGFSCS